MEHDRCFNIDYNEFTTLVKKAKNESSSPSHKKRKKGSNRNVKNTNADTSSNTSSETSPNTNINTNNKNN